jgi:hypothetical protein
MSLAWLGLYAVPSLKESFCVPIHEAAAWGSHGEWLEKAPLRKRS